MHTIKALPIIVSYLLFSISAFFSIFIGHTLYSHLPNSDFRAIITVIVVFPLFYLLALIVFRIFYNFFPLKPGEVISGSSQELISNINVCYLLIFFDPIFKNFFIPVFIMTPLYQLLGAKLGKNTYCNGMILDPYFVTVGDETILGMECLMIPHALEGTRLGYYPIKIGDNVTIGARAIIHAGVTIENGAIVGSGAVVTKNKHIGENEIWGGVPAKFIKKRDDA